MFDNPFFLLALICGVVFSPLIYLEYKKNHNINESYAITISKISFLAVGIILAYMLLMMGLSLLMSIVLFYFK